MFNENINNYNDNKMYVCMFVTNRTGGIYVFNYHLPYNSILSVS